MHNSIKFLLAGRVEEIHECRPTDTVLDYLRERKHRVGTKEGCAEGDCGACTVVLAEAVEGRMRYRAVNSCILFLPALDGKQLITIEDLQQADGSLHPVQQSLVDEHGSQCGFCTPGFVMSLFAMEHGCNEPGGDSAASQMTSRKEINAALAGNLCRCTGYAPIVRAAQKSPGDRPQDEFSTREAGTLRQLEELRSEEMLAMSTPETRCFAPTTLAELCALLKTWPTATMVAGGTDVGLWVTKQLQRLETVIHTSAVEELQLINTDPGANELVIGAAVTYTDAIPHILQAFPEFEELLIRLGALQVRNAGTVGGNIANGSPIGDMPPGLIALNAKLVLASSEGERTIRLEDFFVDYGRQDLRPGECVARILLPLPDGQSEFRTYKVSKRTEQDISAVCAAFCLEFDGDRVVKARIAYGGMAETPKRARHCEAALNGQEWTGQNIMSAMRALDEDYQPISDMRSSAKYRRLAARNLLMRYYLETSATGYPVRLDQPYEHDQAVTD